MSNISEAAAAELQQMFHKHEEAERGYEDDSRYKPFQLPGNLNELYITNIKNN